MRRGKRDVHRSTSGEQRKDATRVPVDTRMCDPHIERPTSLFVPATKSGWCYTAPTGCFCGETTNSGWV